MPGRSWIEYLLKDKYEAEGHDVIHTGIPDLILLKDGKITFVEAKSTTDTVRANQKRAISLLRKHGIEARIEKVRGIDNIMPYIFPEEQDEILARCKLGEVGHVEICGYIARASKFPGTTKFARMLRIIRDDDPHMSIYVKFYEEGLDRREYEL